MYKVAFLQMVRNGLNAKFGFLFKAKTIKYESNILLEISTQNYSQVFDWSVDEQGNVPDADVRLANILDQVWKGIHKSEFFKLKKEINEIRTACAFYAKNSTRGITHPNDYSGKCKKEELVVIGCQLFIFRMHAHFDTLTILSDTESEESFYKYEYSINIILRSCILDSLLMSAWVKDKSRGFRFIRDLIVSSYLLMPIGISAERKIELNNGANYFNVGCKKNITEKRKKKIIEHVSNNGMNKYLNGAKNIKSFRTLYDMYSKFDHFSPIPHFHYLGRPIIEKVDIHRDSLHLIKHALSQMLIKQRDPMTEAFCDLLALPPG